MARVKIPKGESFEKVAYLRNRGMSATEIAAQLGLSRSRIFQIVKEFNIAKCIVCPHCGLDIKEKSE